MEFFLDKAISADVVQLQSSVAWNLSFDYLGLWVYQEVGFCWWKKKD